MPYAARSDWTLGAAAALRHDNNVGNAQSSSDIVGDSTVDARPKTEAAGTATINDMPPGEYTVRVWHPSMERGEETTARRVTLNADGPTSVEWELSLKPALRVPRVSGAASAGYP
jgi:hypothetical protein